ncbi:hypothetical protein VOLCADRAFT_101283 [Volvox carteri f. nagariensis]|uniref:Uncharacterized protein n=1 Tax=Volvox carteri f. nagariensis TaxID=3068 RepID=D8UM80_VOLCA|nr:uncharacterized protein VOLCADRAFT_101283 [Volvox carteri f. nagariensis]EFJ39169.1 hypothetical protein VOLCADRAFT_101283 [Volvox carteri f. nagariensis]|eukprot:XP_002959766.1 hypothetical protein VOLCADRAFT_101283 [Volvox carteri f. nagariensis]
MQHILKSAGMLKAGTTITRLPTPHRGCVVVRSCAATCEASKAREQHALAVASLLASTIVTVASASPALADEAAAATVTSVAVELASTANVSVEGIDALVAPAVEVLLFCPLFCIAFLNLVFSPSAVCEKPQSEAVAIAVAPPAPQAVAAADVELAPEASTTEVAPEPAVEPVSAVLAADEPGGLGDWQRAGLPLSEGASGSKGQGSSNSGGSSGAATGRGTSSGRLTATASSRNGTGSAKATTTKELVSVSSRGRK